MGCKARKTNKQTNKLYELNAAALQDKGGSSGFVQNAAKTRIVTQQEAAFLEAVLEYDFFLQRLHYDVHSELGCGEKCE